MTKTYLRGKTVCRHSNQNEGMRQTESKPEQNCEKDNYRCGLEKLTFESLAKLGIRKRLKDESTNERNLSQFENGPRV